MTGDIPRTFKWSHIVFLRVCVSVIVFSIQLFVVTRFHFVLVVCISHSFIFMSYFLRVLVTTLCRGSFIGIVFPSQICISRMFQSQVHCDRCQEQVSSSFILVTIISE